MASKYLLIIQRSEGSMMAYRQGLRLLRSLKTNHLNSPLYKEVQRFLRMSVRRKESDLRSPLPIASPRSKSQESSSENQLSEEQDIANEQDIISPNRAAPNSNSSGMLGGVFKWLGWS